MEEYILSIDQSTSTTKAILFDKAGKLIHRCNVDHIQYYPQPGWVEHNAEEIYSNTLQAINDVLAQRPAADISFQGGGGIGCLRRIVFPAITIIATRLIREKPFGSILADVILVKVFSVYLSWELPEWYARFD